MPAIIVCIRIAMAACMMWRIIVSHVAAGCLLDFHARTHTTTTTTSRGQAVYIAGDTIVSIYSIITSIGVCWLFVMMHAAIASLLNY